MSTIYSHSRLESFKWCKQAYKAKYVDKIYPDMPRSMELFLGDLVHRSLEWLYHVVKDRNVELDDLIEHFINNWKNEFGKDIRIRNGEAQEYHDKGVKFLINYYMRYRPFEEETVAIEKSILFNLDSEGKYKVRGFIDRLVKLPDGTIEVHDYKTSKRPKTQREADSDWQLAFYHLGIMDTLEEGAKVNLIWHFLANNIKVQSSRTDKQLEDLKKEVLEFITKVENNTSWPACKKPWCDWCAYVENNPKILNELSIDKPVKEIIENKGLNRFNF